MESWHLRVQKARVRVRQALGQHLPHRGVRAGPVPQRLRQRLIAQLRTLQVDPGGHEGRRSQATSTLLTVRLTHGDLLLRSNAIRCRSVRLQAIWRDQKR